MNTDSAPHEERRVLTPAEKRRWRRIEREFHVRAFGEELARINFLPEKKMSWIIGQNSKKWHQKRLISEKLM